GTAMGIDGLVISARFVVLACVALVTMQAQGQGTAGAARGGQVQRQTAAAGGGGQRGGGGGQRGGGGGQADAPAIGQGTLIAGAWGPDALPVDSRDWGWMTKSYVTNYKRPFYNKAKELLFSGKQVTSYTISTLDPDLYCEVRKHYGFVWFEMQHSTMSWDNVAKMIAA